MVTKSWCILSHVRKKVISANGDEIIVFPMLHRNDRERSCSATWLRSQWLLTLCKTVRWPVSLQFSSRHCNVMCFLFDIGGFFSGQRFGFVIMLECRPLSLPTVVVVTMHG